ncbi:MAG: hypothetical protein ACXAEE_07710 [Candidatus Thorarchaeota archaeon]|jgi:hypothetical protein
MVFLNITRDVLVSTLKKHRLFIAVLLLAAVIWTWVFIQAAIDFVTSTVWPRAVWNGYGSIDLFGFSIRFAFEGWADHDYFYHSWANQFLSGLMPYTPEFDLLFQNEAYYNVPYFFPPLYVYICVIGKLLHPDLGIGLVLTAFGFATAFPIYGISTYLSGNRNVGAVAAATYLLSPIILYHTVFEWLNPAPFVFFSMLSFYLLMHNRRLSGVLAMTTAALFKQTAFFFALPLIAFVLKRSPQPISDNEAPPEEEEQNRRPASDELDLKGFVKIALVVCGYAAVLSLPYILDPLNYGNAIFSRAGATYLTDLTSPPPISFPITLAVLFIMIGAPEWFSEIVNLTTFHSIGIIIAIIPILALMLLEVKNDRNLQAYWRRIIFLTLLLMLCVHILSPRGIYKYYTVALVPFFSILSTSSLCQRTSDKVRVSFPMLLVPMVCSFAIMVPARTTYLLYLILMLVAYIINKSFAQTYDLVADPVKKLGQRFLTSVRRQPVA